jgi:hypothetical protein
VSESAVESLYLPVVESIVQRILIAEDALRQVESDSANAIMFVGCEVAVLQIRMICELLLVGSTAAHLHEAGVSISATKWRPKDAFLELAKVNAHPLQVPVAIELHKNGIGQHHIIPKSQPLKFEALSEIYGRCGDLLHVPTVRQISEARLPEFDLGVLWRWLNGFREITMAHTLMLPERQIIMLAIWSGDPQSKPEAYRLDAAGPSTFDIHAYPEFSLLP